MHQGANRFESGVRLRRVSILNRFDELLNINKNGCEIPPFIAGQRRHGHLVRRRRIEMGS